MVFEKTVVMVNSHAEELWSIDRRLRTLREDMIKNYSDNMEHFKELFQEELDAYKVKLETFVAEADDKPIDRYEMGNNQVIVDLSVMLTI